MKSLLNSVDRMGSVGGMGQILAWVLCVHNILAYVKNKKVKKKIKKNGVGL